MYLTTLLPNILDFIQNWPGGLLAINISSRPILLIKTNKEVILTAKINNGFKIYLIPVKIERATGFALVSAFYDTHDEPLTITTPLIKNDKSSIDLINLLCFRTFDVIFFDDHNREMLSYMVDNNFKKQHPRFLLRKLVPVEYHKNVIEEAIFWFSKRNSTDDSNAISINFSRNLFPDDCIIYDITPESNNFNGSIGFSTTQLYQKEPGAYQELDIVLSLYRIYDPKYIFLNPIKTQDNEELTDLIIVGEKEILIIQAKDSPNTEQIIRAQTERKIAKSKKQLAAGISQLKGALAFIKSNPIFAVKCAEKELIIDCSQKQLIGIIVVKELFNEKYQEYSEVIFDAIDKTKTPILFFDYPEFSKMTLYCQSEKILMHTLNYIFKTAMENQIFPRIRYSGKIQEVNS